MILRTRVRQALAAGAAFLLLDACWLTAAGPRLYRPAIGHLMANEVDLLAAGLFYGIYIGGLVGFAIAPAATTRTAALRGALFGLVAYATFDLTAQASLRNWPWHLTLIDLAWGTIASAAACTLAMVSTRKL